MTPVWPLQEVRSPFLQEQRAELGTVGKQLKEQVKKLVLRVVKIGEQFGLPQEQRGTTHQAAADHLKGRRSLLRPWGRQRQKQGGGTTM